MPHSGKRFWRNDRLDRWRRKISHLVTVQYPHDLLPVAPSPEIQPSVSDEQLRVLLAAAVAALEVDLDAIADLLPDPEDAGYVTTWPGEHYRLLAGLAEVLQAAEVVEIGTYKGAAAAVLSERCEKVTTFDIVPVEEIDNSIRDLTVRFPNVEQIVGDLAVPDVWKQLSGLIGAADLVFVDGPKDGVFEPNVVPRIVSVMKPGSVLVLDDIRFAGMRELWIHGIDRSRIDFGSLGHWSGTGIVFI